MGKLKRYTGGSTSRYQHSNNTEGTNTFFYLDSDSLINKTIQDEKKALLEKGKKVFDKIEGVEGLKQRYLNGLREATNNAAGNTGGGN